MNFISHYYFDHQQGNPYFNFGLILPDLMGIARRGWKLHDGFNEANLPDEQKHMYRGAKTHLEMDRFFHNAAYFRKYNQVIKEALVGIGIKNPPYRLFFITHVFLEIMLDRQIVLHHKEILDQFYDDLNQIPDERIDTFFRDFQLPAPNHFFLFFHRFRNDKYLYNYADTHSIIFALNRIFERARQPVLADNLHSKLINCIFELDSIIYHSLRELKSELNNYRS